MPLDPLDRTRRTIRPPIPERVVNPAFEAALAVVLAPARSRRDPRVRLRHGHGHTQEEMWAIKYGALARVPDLVVWPAERDAGARRSSSSRAQHGACLVPYGGGTNVTDALRCPDDERRIDRVGRPAPA